MRQIRADAGHIPEEALDAWQETGPRRVRRALAERLRAWSDEGLLHTTDPELAAVHLLLLVSAAVPSHPGEDEPGPEETDNAIASGVHVFLNGYRR